MEHTKIPNRFCTGGCRAFRCRRRLLDVRTSLQGKPISYINSIDSDFYTKKLIRAGGERLETVFARMDRCIRSKVRIHAGKQFVMISHGDPIMSVATRYAGHPLPRKFSFKNWYVPQASGFKIEFDVKGALCCQVSENCV